MKDRCGILSLCLYRDDLGLALWALDMCEQCIGDIYIYILVSMLLLRPLLLWRLFVVDLVCDGVGDVSIYFVGQSL